MPTEPPFPDSNNPEGFFLIKTETRDKIGNRNSDNKALDYFDEKDAGVVQSTALIQPLNSAEFIPTPGAERETMTKGLNSANFGGLEAQSFQFSWGNFGSIAGMTPINITWTYDNSSTATILNSEKEFGQQMTNYFNGNATDGNNANPLFDSIQNISFSDLIISSHNFAGFLINNFRNPLKTIFSQAIPEINDTNDLSVIIQIFSDIASGQKSFSLAVGQVTSLTNIATENIIDSINKMYGSSFSDQDAVLQDSTKFIQNFFDASQKFDLLKKDLELIIGPAFSSETFWPDFQKFVLGSDLYDSLSQSEINDFNINLISGFLKNQSDISGLSQRMSTGLSFTGLMDTPTGYDDGKILQSTTTGLEWVDMPAGGGAGSVDDITDLPDNPTDGQLITVGCDLFIGCNGEWVKVGADAIAPPSEAPACVSNLEEYNQYTEYKDQFLADNSSTSFSAGLSNQTNIHDFIHDVCLFTDSNLAQEQNTVVIDETTFKWGMFAANQDINITAQPFVGANATCTFKEWKSNLPNFPKTNAQETIFIDQDASITGYFECTVAPNQPSCSEVDFHLQVSSGGAVEDKSDNNRTITNPNNVTNQSFIDDSETLFGESTLFFDNNKLLEFSSANFGSNDFTVEFWLKYDSPITTSTKDIIVTKGVDPTSTIELSITLNQDKLRFLNNLVLEHTNTGMASILSNWTHIAAVRSGNSMYLYVNGQREIDATINGSVYASPYEAEIGNKSYFGGWTNNLKHMQDYRVSKKAVYTSNFTPPAALLPTPC